MATVAFVGLTHHLKLMGIREDYKMSMISEQVHYLRSLAADQTPEALYEVFGALNEAADTIESLSAKLADMEQPAEDCGKELLTII